jgi:hypothetical protein
VKKTSRLKVANVLVLLVAGMSSGLLVALTEDAETQIEHYGLLCIYMFLLSLCVTSQSKMSAFQLTALAIYSRIKTGELKIGYLERLCSLLSLAFGIAGFIDIYTTYLR